MEAPSNTCKFKGCTEQGHSRPVLNFWSKGYFGAPAKCTLALPVCSKHMREVTIADLVDEEGHSFWDKVLVTNGRQPPDHTRTKLTWEPMFN